MTDNVVARRYAQALFSLGNRIGEDALEKNGACLADFSQLMILEPRLATILKSPVVEVSEKKAVLGALLEKLKADPLMRNFFFLLADKNRLGALTAIAEWYGMMLDETKGIRRGTVTTAIKLSADKQEALRKALQQKAGGDLELTFKVDPEILGGMVLTVGDKVLDSSLRAQLGVLRETLIRGL